MNKLFFILVILLGACKSKQEVVKKNSDSSCITKLIETFAKSHCQNNLSVKEYNFQNKKVFVFDQSLCGADMTSEVVDSACKSLGYLGGLTGNTLINGEDFSNALFVNTIWEK